MQSLAFVFETALVFGDCGASNVLVGPVCGFPDS